MSENMLIHSVIDEKIKKYARVIKNYDCTELIEKMQETPLTDGVEYVASFKSLESLPIFQELSEREFGGMPIQLGYCNGDNHKLNAVEYIIALLKYSLWIRSLPGAPDKQRLSNFNT